MTLTLPCFKGFLLWWKEASIRILKTSISGAQLFQLVLSTRASELFPPVQIHQNHWIEVFPCGYLWHLLLTFISIPGAQLFQLLLSIILSSSDSNSPDGGISLCKLVLFTSILFLAPAVSGVLFIKDIWTIPSTFHTFWLSFFWYKEASIAIGIRYFHFSAGSTAHIKLQSESETKRNWILSLFSCCVAVLINNDIWTVPPTEFPV